jgi:hypothetical protein
MIILRWPVLSIPFLILFSIIELAVEIVVAYAVIPLTIPYTLFYYTSNWTMSNKDRPIVQLYLDHFQALYPALMAKVVNARLTRTPYSVPRSIEFWPKESLYIPCSRRTRYTFTQAAGLFFRLEDAGWPRRVLYEFLRNQVEQTGYVSQEEKEAFAAAMRRTCGHDLVGQLWPPPNKALHTLFTGWTMPKLRDWEGKAPGGARIVRVSRESVDWLLQRGAFLVATDVRTLQCMKDLTNVGMWGVVRRDPDLERSYGRYWQVMAFC